jgi:hypothetical protein
MDNKLKQFIITVIICFACCIILGYIFYREHIFEFRSTKFIIFYFGLTGAVIYSALEYRSIKDSVLFTLGLLFLNIVLYKASPFIFVIRDIITFIIFWFGIYLYKISLEKRMEGYKFIRGFAMGVYIALTLCVASLILLLVQVQLSNILSKLVKEIIYSSSQSGMLIGLGIGLGYDISNYIINRIKKIEV